MDRSRFLWRALAGQLTISQQLQRHQPLPSYICNNCLRRLHQNHRPIQTKVPSRPSPILRRRNYAQSQRRSQSNSSKPHENPADEPGFTSPLDNPPTLMRSGRKHNIAGLILLAAMPITAFALGCWQVQRLAWKSDLIARFEDRLVRDPLPLPPHIDPDAIKDFDYRRVYARGKFRHDQEMLIGPRMHDGNDGYLVVTPLERLDAPEGSPTPNTASGTSTTILVNRGWIPKTKAHQSSRPASLPAGEVIVEGLLREPWTKNSFTPNNVPQEGKWYFPDVLEMAAHTGSQAVWIEETMRPDLLMAYDREAKGVPIGRAPEVNLRNNHAQYIFTWFSLSAATTIMMWMLLKRPASGARGARARVRHSTRW